MMKMLPIPITLDLCEFYFALFKSLHNNNCNSNSDRIRQEFVDCKIIQIPGKYDFKPFAIGYQKDSPYAEMFDYHIEEMRNGGVLDRIKNKYNQESQHCPDFRFFYIFLNKDFTRSSSKSFCIAINKMFTL